MVQRIDRAQRRRGTLGAATQLRLAVLHLLSLLTTLALTVLVATAAGLGQFSTWPTPLTRWGHVCGRRTDRTGGRRSAALLAHQRHTSRAPDRPGGKKLNWLDGVAQTWSGASLRQKNIINQIQLYQQQQPWYQVPTNFSNNLVPYVL
eukprot:SAG31_NODE_1382_length_8579_cov_25.152830_10_plen_148_part_00